MTEAEQFLHDGGILDVMNAEEPWLNSQWWEQWRPFLLGDMRAGRLRDEYIERFGFAVPNEEAIRVCVEIGPLVEIGAGSGYWTTEIRAAGGDCVPTDPGTGRYHRAGKHANWEPRCEIERINSVEAVRKYKNRNLLTVWPDYDRSWAAEALNAFKSNVVVYVGEGSGGCTGDDQFHNILEELFDETKVVSIPRFFGLHDRLQVWRRKGRRMINLKGDL